MLIGPAAEGGTPARPIVPSVDLGLFLAARRGSNSVQATR